MTLHLDARDVRALATHEVTMAAAHEALRAESAGEVVLPPRMDVDLPRGFLRVMPAAMGEVMGLKVMTLVRGVGNRYLILLYRQDSGELVATLDADEVTRLRTAATTAVAGELLAPEGTFRLGLLGTGFEAEGHLRTLSRCWPLEEVSVFSRTASRRQEFAERMTAELGIAVQAVSSASAAVSTAPVSVLATKSTEPVVSGTAFPAGAVVLSIGSTRPDLRELDRATLRRAGTLLVDDPRQVAHESADIMDGLASGALREEHIVPMALAATQPQRVHTRDDRDLLVFKSVGTAVQDLALAGAVWRAAQERGLGRDLGELTQLKSAPAPAAGGPAPARTGAA
jgi:ornithine cyclodeaminase/alanine dehydrogenase-like protein (mu-crystallin family)